MSQNKLKEEKTEITFDYLADKGLLAKFDLPEKISYFTTDEMEAIQVALIKMETNIATEDDKILVDIRMKSSTRENVPLAYAFLINELNKRIMEANPKFKEHNPNYRGIDVEMENNGSNGANAYTWPEYEHILHNLQERVLARLDKQHPGIANKFNGVETKVG